MRFLHLGKFLTIGFMLSSLSACVTTPKLTESNWYVRSEFTWWEAKPAFMLKANEDNTAYTVSLKLNPDGKAFNIKIADKQWSQNRNCGVPEQVLDSILELNKWHSLDCDYKGQKIEPLNSSYQFTPQAAGDFILIVTFNEGRPAKLKLLKK